MRKKLLRLLSVSSGDDPDFGARVARLESELNSCSKSDKRAQLEERLRAIPRSHRPSAADLDHIHQIEAERIECLPAELLYPIYVELREKLYRLPPGEGEAIKAELEKVFRNGTVDHATEHKVRHWLHWLVLEIYTSGTNYNRITVERSYVVGLLTVVAIILVVMSLMASLVVLKVWSGVGRRLVLASLAGTVSGTMSAAWSGIREKLRREMIGALVAQLILRTILGAVTAGFVYLAVASGFVSIGFLQNTADEAAKSRFYIALGFAAGWSEKIFTQTLSPFILGEKQKDRGKPKQNPTEDPK